MEYLSNFAKTNLVSGLGPGDGSLSVPPTASFVGTSFRIMIDSEIMLVLGVSGTTWYVSRGLEGTTAASHSSGAEINQILTSAGLSDILQKSRGNYGTVANLPVDDRVGSRYVTTDSIVEYQHQSGGWVGYIGNSFPIKPPTAALTAQFSPLWDTTKTSSYVRYERGMMRVYSTIGTSDYISILKKPLIGGTNRPYTLTVGFNPLNWNWDYSVAGIGIADTVTGKYLGWWESCSQGGGRMELYSYTINGGSGSSVKSDSYGLDEWGLSACCRFYRIYNDGFTRYYQTSIDCNHWETWYSHAATYHLTENAWCLSTHENNTPRSGLIVYHVEEL